MIMNEIIENADYIQHTSGINSYEAMMIAVQIQRNNLLSSLLENIVSILENIEIKSK